MERVLEFAHRSARCVALVCFTALACSGESAPDDPAPAAGSSAIAGASQAASGGQALAGQGGRAGAGSGGANSSGSTAQAGASAAGALSGGSGGNAASAGGGFAATGGSTSGIGAGPTGGANPNPSGGASGAAGGGASDRGGSGSGGTAASGGRSGTGAVAGTAVGGSAGVASGGANSAGAGSAGAPQGGCPTELVGWAAVNGDGVSKTTGGGEVPPVRPTTPQELMAYASDDTPRVIEITSAFSVPRLQINSNKTLVGVGPNAVISGGLRIRGSRTEPVSNVIVRNVRVNGATTDVDGDAVQVYFAHHVWIDHCEIWDGVDANLDVVHASNWVTISWTKFRYTSAAVDPEHKFSNLIGHSDNNASEDTGRLNVTLHHNWWSDGVIERMPRVRFGQVHVYNNYFAADGNNYCIRAGRNARILAESNYFDGVDSPHEFNNAEDEQTAHITARNNVYDGVTGTRATGGGGTPFTMPPYSAPMDAAEAVPERVRACAGPR